jgi:hypothetical protein
MSDFRLPLSGDVTQTINPWTWLFYGAGGQYGLINVNLGNAGDPALERKILDDVGTYGRQIGRIGDALRVLLDHVELDALSPEESEAIADLRRQLAEVDRLKRKHGAAPRRPAIRAA